MPSAMRGHRCDPWIKTLCPSKLDTDDPVVLWAMILTQAATYPHIWWCFFCGTIELLAVWLLGFSCIVIRILAMAKICINLLEQQVMVTAVRNHPNQPEPTRTTRTNRRSSSLVDSSVQVSGPPSNEYLLRPDMFLTGLLH